jgi:hypothetical protein
MPISQTADRTAAFAFFELAVPRVFRTPGWIFPFEKSTPSRVC